MLGPAAMSFTSSTLQDTVGESCTKALTPEVVAIITHVLPVILCYFAMAVLAITPQTRTVRIALLPVVVVLALRAAVPMDVSFKITERNLYHRLAVSVCFDTNILS